MAPLKENSSIKIFLYLWQFWSHSRCKTIFRISKKKWIDYNDKISEFWDKIWKIMKKKNKKKELVLNLSLSESHWDSQKQMWLYPQYESQWDSQNQMRLENYPQCESQCDTQWDSQNHMKRANMRYMPKRLPFLSTFYIKMYFFFTNKPFHQKCRNFYLR